MDPDANLEQQLELARELLRVCEDENCIDANESPDLLDVSSLAEHVIALHEWITKGGALPSAWRPATETATPPNVYVVLTDHAHEPKIFINELDAIDYANSSGYGPVETLALRTHHDTVELLADLAEESS